MRDGVPSKEKHGWSLMPLNALPASAALTILQICVVPPVHTSLPPPLICSAPELMCLSSATSFSSSMCAHQLPFIRWSDAEPASIPQLESLCSGSMTTPMPPDSLARNSAHDWLS